MSQHTDHRERLTNRTIDSLTSRADRVAMGVMQIRDLLGKDRRARWRVTTTLDKFDGDWTGEQIDAGLADGAPADRPELALQPHRGRGRPGLTWRYVG